MLTRLIKRLQQLTAKLNNFIKWGMPKCRLVEVIFAISRVERQIDELKTLEDVDAFEVNGYLVERNYKEGRDEPSTYHFVIRQGYDQIIDIRSILGHQRLCLDCFDSNWRKVENDYNNLHRHKRFNYSSYDQWESKVWIPYVKSRLALYFAA